MHIKIELLIGDSKRQSVMATQEANRLVQRGSVALIGPGSSEPTIQVSKLLSKPSVNRTLIGYSATSPALSRQQEYSNFLRTPPSTRNVARLTAKLMRGAIAIFGAICN